jgi:PadR family transcriptional regulator PadR
MPDPALDEWVAQMRRGMLEFCILALLEEGASYGYEIVTRLAEAPLLAAGEGTVYPLLRRLRRDGRVATFWRESEAGPPRQYYELTANGRQYTHDLRQQWRRLGDQVRRLLDPRS